jgi:hypothetical protein
LLVVSHQMSPSQGVYCSDTSALPPVRRHRVQIICS